MFIDEVLQKVYPDRICKEAKTRYSFSDVPDWAKPYVKDEWGEKQTYMDLYCDPDFVELTYKEGGDVLTFRVYKNGLIVER